MSEPKGVKRLIERFERNRDAYRSHEYNETQLRREFIDPFFKALGWDVTNEKGYAEAYKEVIHEDAIKVGGATKAPDYCFRIGGTRKFFVEAKRPSVGIKDDPIPAYQLRRYAWSAKLPLSILTDFEEFAVYDCRVKPAKTDKASAARVLYLTVEEYADQWDEIATIFSQEAILTGSFDRYVESTKRKRGTAEVDDAFLKEIENWRDVLARNIALRNADLSTRELNFAVQRTIDRIIFLRICEDRGIEDYGQLMALQSGNRVYPRLCQILRRADERYNSGLFHFRKEKDRPEPPDGLTLSLTVDDKVLKEVFKDLYYPDSPYEFSVLPADILGHIYEQFLGKVIRLTPGHHAKVEDKPEVKKAGGVYYTPTYIVDYIVEHTIGKLLEEKTPNQVAKLRVLDPACGSGSFLLGAYQTLLDWHLTWYSENEPEKHAKGRKSKIFRGPGGDWRLTTSEKKRILLNNIYGVDIDTQAVEVTKLSLLLKVLEGENAETIGQGLRLFHQRALPDLADNIKCGNSLIGPDFYKGKQLALIDEEERYRINAFDWNAEFPEIMQADGFDAVIGNPPYVYGRDWKSLGITDSEKSYLGMKYKSSPYQLDMFSIFIERAANLCKDAGRVSQIVPNVWLTNEYSSKTRAFVLGHATDLCIATPPPGTFVSLTVDTSIYSYEKSCRPGRTFKIMMLARSGEVTLVAKHKTSDYSNGERPISTTLDTATSSIVYRLKSEFPSLGGFAELTRGVHPYRLGGYGRSAYGSGPQTRRDLEERPYHSKVKKKGMRTFIYGRDLDRFSPLVPTEFVSYGPWLAEPRKERFFEGERVYSRKILGERLIVTVEEKDSVADQQVYISKPLKTLPSAKFLAGILGSKLVAFFIRSYYDEAHDAFPQIKVGQLRSLPIAFKDDDSEIHDRMVELVETMLKLHKDLKVAKTDHEKSLIQRQIDATDKQIDQLVYELYGLTDEEIRTVEEATK